MITSLETYIGNETYHTDSVIKFIDLLLNINKTEADKYTGWVVFELPNGLYQAWFQYGIDEYNKKVSTLYDSMQGLQTYYQDTDIGALHTASALMTRDMTHDYRFEQSHDILSPSDYYKRL